jgi:hypothetical protein
LFFLVKFNACRVAACANGRSVFNSRARFTQAIVTPLAATFTPTRRIAIDLFGAASSFRWQQH